MKFVTSACALAAVLGFAVPASAQDEAAMMRESAANQLGVMEYCQAQGFIDASAVASQRSALAALPGSGGNAAQAEAAGKKGVISMGGSEMPLATMASQGGTTVEGFCKQLGESAAMTAPK